MLVCAGVYGANRRNWIATRWVSSVANLMWAYGVGLTAWGFGLTASNDFVLLSAIMVFMTGPLQLFRRWVLISIGYAWAVWLPLGFVTSGRTFAVEAVALIAVGIVAWMVHEVAMRYLRDLEALRLRDREHQHEREQLLEQLLQSQKLEAVGTLAGGVAHDMNNVLAAIIGLAEIVRDDLTGPARDDVGQILDSARRGAALTRNLLGFSRRGKYHKESVAVADLVGSVSKLLTRTLPKGITICVEGVVECDVDGDAAQLSHALMNLCLNASDAMAGDGLLRIQVGDVTIDPARATVLSIEPGRYVALDVSDSGSGMSPEHQARIFEPFFTTKEKGRGTGLGLSMVYGTVQAHKGAIEVDSELGRGTVVTVYLPTTNASVPAAVPGLAPAPTALVPAGATLVMIVDDEPLVRAVTRRWIERAGYQAIDAANGREAVELYAQRLGEIRAVVLDMEMPVMGGAECFATLKRLDPTVRVVIASGFTTERDTQACLDAGALGFLEKPYAAQQLIDVISRASVDRPVAAVQVGTAARPTSVQ
jgi:signal transduction histidine kinase/CheY-like chemotaxis protein